MAGGGVTALGIVCVLMFMINLYMIMLHSTGRTRAVRHPGSLWFAAAAWALGAACFLVIQ